MRRQVQEGRRHSYFRKPEEDDGLLQLRFCVLNDNEAAGHAKSWRRPRVVNYGRRRSKVCEQRRNV